MNDGLHVLLLADIQSAHTQQWVRGLTERGLTISVFSLRSDSQPSVFADLESVRVVYANDERRLRWLGKLSVLQLLTYRRRVRNAIEACEPKIVHAHGLDKYAMVGLQGRFHPFIGSAYGSDLMVFPKRSPLHRQWIKSILGRADVLLATSTALAEAGAPYTNRSFEMATRFV